MQALKDWSIIFESARVHRTERMQRVACAAPTKPISTTRSHPALSRGPQELRIPELPDNGRQISGGLQEDTTGP